ncbi:MAG: glycosyltransferase family 2 protein [Patescibacteria group bacterium]
MKISFVVPAYNEEVYIEDCLRAILKEIETRPYSAEVIVVNNASTDRTAEVAKKFPGVRVVDEKHKGLVWARQRGLSEASGELVANIDADVQITPGWLERVLSEFERNPRLVCLSGPFIYYDLSLWTRFWVRIFYFIGFLLYLLNRFVLRAGSMTQGGNFILRRTAILAAGGFDTSIAFYGEDTDIARRMSKIGAVKFTFHLPARSSGRRLRDEGVIATALRYTLNYLWVTFRHRPLHKEYKDIRRNQHENCNQP